VIEAADPVLNAIAEMRKKKRTAQNDVGAPANRIEKSRRLQVLTPRLPQFITPVLEHGLARFGWRLYWM
jgi:hypothetical protein